MEYKKSERYRAICEATSTLKTEKQQRIKYLNLVEKHRGKLARQKLEAEILKQWNILKGKKNV
jgi:hypothetical protein